MSELDLSPERALIFRITHIENLPWILQNGIYCRNSDQQDPNFRQIGNPELIEKRAHRVVEIGPGGNLCDYVPFYFTPHSPMLYNIKTGYNGTKRTAIAEIVIMTSSLHRVVEANLSFVFTDSHAYLNTARYRRELKDLDIVDWKLLASRNFKRDPNDPGRFSRYQAEALIHRQLPVSTLLGIACYDTQADARVRGFLDEAGIPLKTAVRGGWYF